MKLKIKNINQCEQILNIRPVNPVFVSRYRQSMRNGDQFPPLLIDQDNQVVSGNHRYQAYLDEFGPEHSVEVERRKYKDEASRVEDAVKDNAKHGNPLDGISRKRAILRLSELGKQSDSIAQLLGVSVKRVEEMAGQTVMVIGGDRKRHPKPIKRGLSHIAGQSVSASQYQQHEKHDRGVNAVFMANQLTRWLKNDWVNIDDPKTYEALTHLQTALNDIIQ